MAGVTAQLIARKQKTLQEIYESLNTVTDVEQISKNEQIINDVVIWTLAYERLFVRAGSYCSAIVILTEHETEQSAFVVASGGGDSINFSYGANRRFAKDCVEKLETCGFIIVHSDLDKQRKGFIARFLE